MKRSPATLNTTRPIAVVVDNDIGLLARATELLGKARYQVLGRLSPRGLLETLTALRPEILLLGVNFWDQGWGPVLRSASPDTVVFPLSDGTASPGVVDVTTIPTLLALSGEAGRRPEFHAA